MGTQATLRDAVIVDAVRTPFGRRAGSLSHWHPVDLAAETLTALVDRTGIDPGVESARHLTGREAEPLAALFDLRCQGVFLGQ